jgi:hypothetical protein
MGTIANAKDTPLNVRTGTVPDVGGGLRDWFQPMTFTQILKETIGFQLVEIITETNFFGVIQPLTGRRLMLKPEGQRAWTWLWLHADPSLELEVDDVVTYLGVKTRVMARKDYSIYGYVEYELVQDWVDAGALQDLDGGDAFAADFLYTDLDGGDASSMDFIDINGGTADGSL